MYQSENINELATALSKAQGESDCQLEAFIIHRMLNRKFASNDKTHGSVNFRFFEKIAYGASSCWYWIGHIDLFGYGRFKYLDQNKAHRSSWILFKGKIPDGMKVLHKCDVRSCVNPEHLFLGTQQENVRDMIFKKRHKFPIRKSKENNPMSKLTQSAVEEIRKIYSKGKLGYTNISRKFGVSPTTVKRVITNQTWVK